MSKYSLSQIKHILPCLRMINYLKIKQYPKPLLRASRINFSTRKDPLDDKNFIKDQSKPNQNTNRNFEYLKKILLLFSITGATFYFTNNIVGPYLFPTQASRSQSSAQNQKNQNIKLGGSWKLTNTQGKQFSSSDLGKSYYLIYFGFAKCPQICPTTLRYTTSVYRILKTLPESDKINLKIVFVSIDPARDTPQAIKKYLSLFDKNIIGLTGQSEDDPNLKDIMKKFKIYATKIQNPDSPKSYDIDHTALVFLMDSQNRYVDSLNPSFSQKVTAQRLLQKIINDQLQKKKEK